MFRAEAPLSRDAPLLDSTQEAASIVDPEDAARSAGLRYVTDQQAGIGRKKSGKGFTYLNPDGSRLEDNQILTRIRSIVIPPAWTDVWICRFANGHALATGRDARGRKQYCYHPLFREIREGAKFEHMMMFARALPAIRAMVREHIALRGLPRQKVLATVVHLLETTLICVVNDDHARQLWPDDPQEPPRRGGGLTATFPLHRQERKEVVGRRQGSAGRKGPGRARGEPGPAPASP
jgi:DNA topoisomerase-1